ncbi:hypothetical protein B5X24_HaOG203781 [Helicoverpa armigera]|nr:hypothetical protein B5X24_HaOG203781 [Helicoverpa armigera]
MKILFVLGVLLYLVAAEPRYHTWNGNEMSVQEYVHRPPREGELQNPYPPPMLTAGAMKQFYERQRSQSSWRPNRQRTIRRPNRPSRPNRPNRPNRPRGPSRPYRRPQPRNQPRYYNYGYQRPKPYVFGSPTFY